MTIGEALEKADLARLEVEVLLAALLKHERTWLLTHSEKKLSEHQRRQWREWVARRKAGEPASSITGSKEFYGLDFHVTKDVLIPRPSTEGLIDVALQFLIDGKDRVLEVDEGIVAVARSFLPSPLTPPLPSPPAPLPCAGEGGAVPLISRITSFPSPQRGEGLGVRAMETLVDIGTGSGCIAIALAKHIPGIPIIATDASREALKVAKRNAKLHKVEDRIHFLYGDLL